MTYENKFRNDYKKEMERRIGIRGVGINEVEIKVIKDGINGIYYDIQNVFNRLDREVHIYDKLDNAGIALLVVKYEGDLPEELIKYVETSMHRMYMYVDSNIIPSKQMAIINREVM